MTYEQQPILFARINRMSETVYSVCLPTNDKTTQWIDTQSAELHAKLVHPAPCDTCNVINVLNPTWAAIWASRRATHTRMHT